MLSTFKREKKKILKSSLNAGRRKKKSHAVQTKTGRYCSTSNPNDIKEKEILLLSTRKQLKTVAVRHCNSGLVLLG